MKVYIAIFVFISLLFISCINRSSDEMVLVVGGTFVAGSTDIESDPDEHILKLVSVNDFYISKYEVSQSEWYDVMKTNPSFFHGKNLPVECVSWDDVYLFIKKLNMKTGRHYRLPTQEEWEYAAKGGIYAFEGKYSGSDNLDDIAWYRNNSRKTTHRLGTCKPNSLGLYDMTGNVHEWCDGGYDSLYYSQDTIMNQKVIFDDIRVFKGGSWASHAKHCRISNINYNSRETKNFTIGFRLAEDVTKN